MNKMLRSNFFFLDLQCSGAQKVLCWTWSDVNKCSEGTISQESTCLDKNDPKKKNAVYDPQPEKKMLGGDVHI